MNLFFKKPLLCVAMLLACTTINAESQKSENQDTFITLEEGRRGGAAGGEGERARSYPNQRVQAQQYPNAHGQGAAYEAGKNQGEAQGGNANNEVQQPIEPYYVEPQQNYGYPAPGGQ